MNSLLILRLSALGDVIHTMPAVVALAQTLRPQTRLGWVVEAAFADLVSTVAPVDVVFPVATRRWRRNPLSSATVADLKKVRRELRAFARDETAIDFQGLAKSAALALISSAGRRIGFERGAVREKIASILYTDPVSVDRSAHVVEWNMELARAAGAKSHGTPVPDFTKFAVDRDGSLADITSTKPIVIVPGTGRSEKEWNIDHYGQLADRLAKLLGSQPVVAWGPGERHLAERVAAIGSATVAPPTDLRQLAHLFRHSRLVVGGDTGPLHLADALGTRVVGLYGPTNPRRNGPYHQLSHCVETYSTTRRMDSIEVETVMRKVEQVLA